ncbi:DUF4396 domain-containing protein [Anaerorhabdus sp.]|uniref:DUF4396 domain-containing protein n=1 Tax=Anaerorhabdus sp. TaxID=1872524 RepID=UPI002FCC4095
MNFTLLSTFFILLGIFCAIIITIDLLLHPQEMMVMNFVWPINALWAGPLCVWAYFTIGKHRKMKMPMDMNDKDMDMKQMDMPMNMNDKDMDMKQMDMPMNMNDKDMDMKQMDMPTKKEKYSSYWQGIIVDTLHCGAGCTLADLIGPVLFTFIPFALFNQLTYGEWVLDFVIALIIGATFQYAAIAPMKKEKGFSVWIQALKIDFLSLSSWQIGMYGWMAIVIFILFGRLSITTPEFWFMMQIAMCFGFITAYPMNWFLVLKGIKTGM